MATELIQLAQGETSVEELIQHLQRQPTSATVLLEHWLAGTESPREREHALTAIKNESERLLVVDSAAAEHLADALAALGERTAGTEELQQAVDACGEALAVFEQAGAAYYADVARRHCAGAEALLRQRRDGAG